jgi:hypothetical protein
MSDTCALFADIAERVKRGEVSPGVAHGAQRCATAGDVRGRRLFLQSLSAFRSNILDAADLSPGCREQMLAFLREVDALAPTSGSFDRAMTARAAQ